MNTTQYVTEFIKKWKESKARGHNWSTSSGGPATLTIDQLNKLTETRIQISLADFHAIDQLVATYENRSHSNSYWDR